MKNILSSVKFIAAALCAALIVSCTPASSIDAQAATWKGIDVSQWQGDINWNAVKASGIDYAMIRVGNFKYGLDSKFVQNVIAANQAGIRVGAYVYTYAKTEAEAALDAQFAIGAMANLPVSLPIAIDMEDSSQKSLSPAQQQAMVNAFCMTIYNAGYHPMVYASKDWFINRLGATMWDQWVAEYNPSCSYPGAYTMWQSSCKGKVSGIQGDVDTDYLYVDYFSAIPQEGMITKGGKTYLYANFRRQYGMQNYGGLLYFFGADGAMVKDVTNVDAAGNIIRYCKDGHVVSITAEQIAVAAAAQQQLEAAAASQIQAAQQSAAFDQNAAAFTAELAKVQAQCDQLLQTAAATQALAQQMPTAENLQTAAELQAQAQLFAEQTAILQQQTAEALAAADAAKQQLAYADAVFAQAQAVLQQAAAAVAIPD